MSEQFTVEQQLKDAKAKLERVALQRNGTWVMLAASATVWTLVALAGGAPRSDWQFYEKGPRELTFLASLYLFAFIGVVAVLILAGIAAIGWKEHRRPVPAPPPRPPMPEHPIDPLPRERGVSKFTDEYGENLKFGKYTKWACDLTDAELIGLLWAIGEYGIRAPLSEMLKGNYDLTTASFYGAGGKARAMRSLRVLAEAVRGRRRFTVGDLDGEIADALSEAHRLIREQPNDGTGGAAR